MELWSVLAIKWAFGILGSLHYWVMDRASELWGTSAVVVHWFLSQPLLIQAIIAACYLFIGWRIARGHMPNQPIPGMGLRIVTTFLWLPFILFGLGMGLAFEIYTLAFCFALTVSMLALAVLVWEFPIRALLG